MNLPEKVCVNRKYRTSMLVRYCESRMRHHYFQLWRHADELNATNLTMTQILNVSNSREYLCVIETRTQNKRILECMNMRRCQLLTTRVENVTMMSFKWQINGRTKQTKIYKRCIQNLSKKLQRC